MTTGINILALPVELQLLITDHLTVPEIELLRLTCRHFYSLLPASKSLDDLLKIEKSAYNHSFFSSCFTCRLLRPDSDFRRISGSDGPQNMECKVCGFGRRLCNDVYGPGTENWRIRQEEKRMLEASRRRQGLKSWAGIGGCDTEGGSNV